MGRLWMIDADILISKNWEALHTWAGGKLKRVAGGGPGRPSRGFFWDDEVHSHETYECSLFLVHGFYPLFISALHGQGRGNGGSVFGFRLCSPLCCNRCCRLFFKLWKRVYPSLWTKIASLQIGSTYPFDSLTFGLLFRRCGLHVSL